MDTNIHDVEAAGDIFAAVAEKSDSMAVEEVIAYLETLRAVIKAGTDAVAMLKTQLHQLLDSPVQVGDKIWVSQDDGKYRPDHDVVVAAIISQSIADENGEIRPVDQAVRIAIELMKRCYVEPSGMPKTAGLIRLGLDKRSVSHWEKTGKKIETLDLNGGAPDDG